jgi:hypothetical protein
MNIVASPSGERVVLIDGSLPKPKEWEALLADGCTISVGSMPHDAKTLDALGPYARRIRRLIVVSASCSDLRAVDDMSSLESLVVNGPMTHAPTFSGTPALNHYYGPAKRFEGVFALDSIRSIDVECGRTRLPLITGPVEVLQLRSASLVSDLNLVAEPSKLVSLSVHGAARLDLSLIAAMPNLRSVRFESCRWRILRPSCWKTARALTALSSWCR